MAPACGISIAAFAPQRAAAFTRCEQSKRSAQCQYSRRDALAASLLAAGSLQLPRRCLAEEAAAPGSSWASQDERCAGLHFGCGEFAHVHSVSSLGASAFDVSSRRASKHRLAACCHALAGQSSASKKFSSPHLQADATQRDGGVRLGQAAAILWRRAGHAHAACALAARRRCARLLRCAHACFL